MTNNDLIINCSRGDEKAIDILYRTYHENLFRVCLKYAGNEYDACDYMHDGFIHILKRIKAVNPEMVSSLGGWLCTVMRNFILDQIRANKKQIYCDFIENVFDSEDNNYDNDNRNQTSNRDNSYHNFMNNHDNFFF